MAFLKHREFSNETLFELRLQTLVGCPVCHNLIRFFINQTYTITRTNSLTTLSSPSHRKGYSSSYNLFITFFVFFNCNSSWTTLDSKTINQQELSQAFYFYVKILDTLELSQCFDDIISVNTYINCSIICIISESHTGCGNVVKKENFYFKQSRERFLRQGELYAEPKENAQSNQLKEWEEHNRLRDKDFSMST